MIKLNMKLIINRLEMQFKLYAEANNDVIFRKNS